MEKKKLQMEKSYSKMNKSEKRIAIAKDVITQIKLQKYIPNSGSYIEHDFKKDVDIKKSFDLIQNCSVCAMGACLLSITKFENKLKWGDVGKKITILDNKKVRLLFKKLFSPLQLLLIETAFEGYSSSGDRVGKCLFDETLTDKEIEACDKFERRYSEDDERMIKIMRNIIRNKGEFKP